MGSPEDKLKEHFEKNILVDYKDSYFPDMPCMKNESFEKQCAELE